MKISKIDKKIVDCHWLKKEIPNGLQNYLKVDADFDFTLDKKEEDVKVNYYVNHMKINNRRGPANYLVIIPGYSVKSFCWDVESVLQYQSILVEKGFTDVLIFNLGGCKEPKSKFSKVGKRDELDQLITKYVKMCLVEAFNFTEKTNCALLGRSAGGGIAIRLSSDKNNTFIKKLYLMAPGHDNTGLSGFLSGVGKDKKIPVRIGWVECDNKVPIEPKGYNMEKQMKDCKYPDFKMIVNKKIKCNDETVFHRLIPDFLKSW